MEKTNGRGSVRNFTLV